MKMTDEELLAALADPGEDPAQMERISTESTPDSTCSRADWARQSLS
ncbi:hypothetical protein ACX80S_05485 [Arthrobacter sp. RHLT1-20]